MEFVMADVFGKCSSRKRHLTCAWSEAKTWICGGEKRKIPGRKKQQEHREAGSFAGKELWMLSRVSLSPVSEAQDTLLLQTVFSSMFL